MKGFIDLGEKYSPEMAKPATGLKQNVHYPYLSLTGKQAIGGKVGQTVTATVKLKLKSASIDKSEKGNTHRESFDVLGIRPGTMSGESSVEELMEDHTDGGKMNLQSVIDSGLKESASKSVKKKTDHLKQHQFKKKS